MLTESSPIMQAMETTDRLPTIKEELARRGIKIIDAIREANLEEKEASVRTWLARNIWPETELLLFARENGLGDTVEELAERYDATLIGSDPDKLLKIRQLRVVKPIESLFKQASQGYVLDYRTSPPTRHESLSDVVVYVQSASGFIAESDTALQDSIIDLVRQGVHLAYMIGADDNTPFDTNPHVQRIARAFSVRCVKGAIDDQILERAFCIPIHDTVSIPDLLTRTVLVATRPDRDSLRSKPFCIRTSVLQLHVGIDHRLGVTRFGNTTWRAIDDVATFDLDVYHTYVKRMFKNAPTSAGSNIAALSVSDIVNLDSEKDSL